MDRYARRRSVRAEGAEVVSAEIEIGSKVRLLKNIWDDGDDSHHPPGYLAMSGEVMVVRSVNPHSLSVSHAHITDRTFAVYEGEWELLP